MLNHAFSTKASKFQHPSRLTVLFWNHALIASGSMDSLRETQCNQWWYTLIALADVLPDSPADFTIDSIAFTFTLTRLMQSMVTSAYPEWRNNCISNVPSSLCCSQWYHTLWIILVDYINYVINCKQVVLFDPHAIKQGHSHNNLVIWLWTIPFTACCNWIQCYTVIKNTRKGT